MLKKERGRERKKERNQERKKERKEGRNHIGSRRKHGSIFLQHRNREKI